MDKSEGLIAAFRLDGAGGGEAVDWHDIGKPGKGLLWVHLNRQSQAARQWINEASGLDPDVGEALLAEEARPRCTRHNDGTILTLRGVNLNPGADPEDMVAVRAWVEPTRIVTTRGRRVIATQDIADALGAGRGPRTAGDFVADLAERLVDRMAFVITELDDNVDALEDEILVVQSGALRSRLGELRREAIALRRYLAPQREALGQLATLDTPWLDARRRAKLREVADQVVRYVEDLDAARERAAVIQDELTNRLSEQMNRTMYALSLVAGIFLPLSFITGLLGINVAGIPGAETPWAFVAVCGALLAVGLFELWLFRKLRWV